MVLLLAPELRCPFLSTGFRHQASATQSDKTCSTRFLPGAEDLGLHVYSMLVEQVFNSQGNADWHSCSRAVPPYLQRLQEQRLGGDEASGCRPFMVEWGELVEPICQDLHRGNQRLKSLGNDRDRIEQLKKGLAEARPGPKMQILCAQLSPHNIPEGL